LAADLGHADATSTALLGHKAPSITGRPIRSADSVSLAAADLIATGIMKLMEGGGLPLQT